MNNQSFQSLLKQVNQSSCPESINLHIHSIYSDGSLSPAEILTQATELEVKHISITDHHSVRAFRDLDVILSKIKSDSKNLPKIWNGIEISCLLKKCLVHVLAYDFDIDNKNIKPYTLSEATNGSLLQAENVVKAIHDSGGVAILAHPARYRTPYNILIEEAHRLNFDGAEAWYDYNMGPLFKPTGIICEAIDKQLKNIGLLSSCGTDSHGYSIKCR